MISEKEFLDAIDIVRRYKEQVNNLAMQAEAVHAKKTLISDWINKNSDKISTRLYNALKYNDIWNPKNKILQKIYVEDLDRKSFLAIHGTGKNTWIEFWNVLGDTIMEQK